MAQDILPTNTQALLIQALGDLEPMVLSREHPIIDRISKTKGGGLGVKQPILTGWGGGISGDFAQSLAAAKVNAANAQSFTVSPAVLYGNEIIDWTSSRYSDDPDHSAIKTAILCTKGAMENAVDNFANMICGDGSGVLARIQTVTAIGGGVYDLTLYSISDVGKFQQDYVVGSKATPFAASLDSGFGTVTGMNQVGGAIRVQNDGTWVPAADHYLGIKGQIAASTDVVTFPGMFGYVPNFDARTNGLPTVTTFLGVDRGPGSAGVAVSGWAFDGTDQPIAVVANQAAGAMSNYKNAKPKQMFVNGVDLPKLAQDVNQQVRYDMPSNSGIAEILYSGFELGLTTGKVEVLAEPAVPAGTAILTNASQWVIKSPGKLFAPASNGQVMVQSYDLNRARFSVECSGIFTTSNPPATAMLKLY